MPRKSGFKQEIADEICRRLVEGESLRRVCADSDMPSVTTVCKWLGQFEPFAEQYARAREAQADALFDEILDIADDGQNDWMERLDGEGENVGWQVNGEALQRSKLRVDARKWMASKLLPKKYGDKVDHTVGGPPGDDGEPTAIEIRIVDPARD